MYEGVNGLLCLPMINVIDMQCDFAKLLPLKNSDKNEDYEPGPPGSQDPMTSPTCPLAAHLLNFECILNNMLCKFFLSENFNSVNL